MRYYIFIVVFMLFFSGCTMKSPSITEYRINSKTHSNELKSTGCKDKSLKVVEAFSSSSLMSLDMNYGVDSHKQFTYSQSQYSISPNHAVSSEILRLVKEMNIFKSVQISKSRSRNDMILETSIDEFMQYFEDSENRSYVKIRISMTLINTKNSKVIATDTFVSRVDTKSLDAEGGVEALNIALSDVLSKSSYWLGDICK